MRRRVVPALIGLLAAALAALRLRAGRRPRAPLEGESAATTLAEPARQLTVPPAPADVEPVAPEPTPAEATPAPHEPPRTDGPRFVSVPWTLTSGDDDADASPDADELPIRFTLLGERMELDRVDVRETESQVFVTVLARFEPPPAGRPWVPYGVAGETTVRLARPLGDRALVHAPDQFDELTRGG